ncbi:hypothetical protein [Luteibaculum oceani]|uniref:Outer membrane beta-barrel protein n=1 Tax=Luteibaculum oceani TaxID=1294296 RepID=A0A5C6US50_9FLAO|nr:hypothetical protein [Luteibaculum oceani]TXC76057.1 hypothetical protein FRX97_11120 [Luteibaculum oceani]
MNTPHTKLFYRHVVVALLCLFGQHLSAQDLLVTSARDSLNGKVDRVARDPFIFYLESDKGLDTLYFNRDQVLGIKFNYYKNLEALKLDSTGQSNLSDPIPDKWYYRFKFSIDFGYCRWLLDIPSSKFGFGEHVGAIKNGNKVAGEICIPIKRSNALAINFGQFRSYAKTTTGNYSFRQTYEDDVTITSVGVTYVVLAKLNQQREFNLGLGLDYCFFNNSDIIKAKTLIPRLDLKFELAHGENFAPYIRVSGSYAEINEVMVSEDGNDQKKEETDKAYSLGTVSIGLGISIFN